MNFTPPFIPSFNVSSDTTRLLIKAGAGIGIYILAKHLYEQWQKKQAEDLINTPAGQIALQLQNIVESTPVDRSAFQRVMQQVNAENDKDVRDIYYKKTGRLLSDDESKYLSAQSQETAAHQYAINSTPGTLISITNDQIKFNVGPGSNVRFAPGQTTGISLYLKPEDIGSGAVPAVVMPPNSKYWKVTQVKLVDVNSLRMRKDWKLIFAPVLPFLLAQRTHKQYAAVQIDVSSGKGKTLLWANATDFRLAKTLQGTSLPEVIARVATGVFSKEFKKLGTATRGTVIGTPLMTMDTGKGKYIQVRTIQGLIRWVRADQVTIKD
jgi:hypothetical protein